MPVFSLAAVTAAAAVIQSGSPSAASSPGPSAAAQSSASSAVALLWHCASTFPRFHIDLAPAVPSLSHCLAELRWHDDVDAPLLRATAFACICSCVSDATHPKRAAAATAALSSPAAARLTAAAAATALCSHAMVPLSHDEARMLVAAGLHALSRAFEHSATAPVETPAQDWEFALAGWVNRLSLSDLGGGIAGEGSQLLAAITLVQGRCKKWLEKRRGEERTQAERRSGCESGGGGSSSSSSSSSSKAADMTAMD
jgi:hypothetical protein